jgi:hypothetical protein
MTVKDVALDLVKNNQFLDTDQTIHAQWNHHLYTQPDIYGYYSGSVSASSYYVTSAASAAVSVNSNTFSSASSITGLSTLNSENAVRLTFDAQITAFPTSFDDVYTDYLIKIIPYSGATALSQYTDVKTVKLVDNVYNKFEIIFIGNSESGTKFDRLDISIKACATISSGTASVAFKNFGVSRVSSDEIIELQSDRLSEIFTPHRPGDQLLENDLLSTSSPYNIISQYYITMDGLADSPKNDINLVPTALSPFNEFKYFITPRSGDNLTSASFNIFSIYNSPVKANEIYVKTQNLDMPNIVEGKITSVAVLVKESGTWNTAATITTASVIQKGSFILRWSGSAWTTGSITYPQINSTDGTLSGYKTIEGIRLQFNLTGNTYSDTKAVNKCLRVRLIEISPRLKLDLSNFMVSGNVKTSIDEGNLPVPVGMSSANDGSLTLENLPRYASANSGPVFQIFNNNSNSPLAGLIMPEVKFTIYSNIYDTVSPSSSAQIKLATMYANNWSTDGIETVSIPLSDYGKQMQTMKAPDLLLMSSETPNQIGNWKKIVECLLQAGGFSDYDRASLQQVSDGILKRYGTNNIFFSSNEKTLWNMLTEIFLSWQVSFSFDNNGILQFRDLLRETKTTTYSGTASGYSGYFQLTDTASNSFIPNISTISQDFKEPIGKITTSYRNFSYAANAPVDNPKDWGASKDVTNYSQVPWKPNDRRILDCAYIESPIAIDDNTIKAGTSLWNAGASAGTLPKYVSNFSGYGIIENEIIYWGGIEYAFSPYISGFPSNETITSSEDLLAKVANRIGADNAVTITAASGNASASTVTITANNTYVVGDTIYISIPDFLNKFVTVTARTSTTFTFKETVNPTNYNISCSGVASKSVYHVSYYPTGKLMNVQRGLFGTNAAAHQYKYTFSDSSVFKGNGSLMTLGQSIDQGSNGVSVLASPKAGVNYLGFYQKDSELYNHYQVSITPRDNLGTIGIFIGASATPSGGNVSFTYSAPTNFSTGMFIEFFTSAFNKNNAGRVWYGALGNNNPAYAIKDFMIENTYIKIKGVPKRNPKTGKILKNSKGHTIWKVAPQNKPATNYVIDVYVNIKTKTITMKVNGKTVNFKNIANNNVVSKIVAPALTRAARTFGVFSRNTIADTVIYVNSLEAVCNGQHLGGDEDGFNTLEPKNSLDYLLSPYGTPPAIQRPFSLKVKPLLRGISIYDVKFNGDVPYFHFELVRPGGLVGFYNANPDDFQISTLIGTPFRAKIAVRNRSNQVLFPVVESGDSTSLGIAGKAIIVQADQKFTTNVSVMPGLQNIEINAPWCPNENVAEIINSDISKNLYAMNQVYRVETFGNPGLEAGDYVYMTYYLKNISGYFIVSSAEFAFGGGGMSTNLTLRSLHIGS